jgi:hypothetical protein
MVITAGFSRSTDGPVTIDVVDLRCAGRHRMDRSSCTMAAVPSVGAGMEPLNSAILYLAITGCTLSDGVRGYCVLIGEGSRTSYLASGTA